MGQGISTSQWYIYGRRHFTQTGYQKHVSKYTDPVQRNAGICVGAPGSDGVDMTGKVVLVTGANSGIGRELAEYSAAKGAQVYMVCRSEDRAKKARDAIIETTGTSEDKVKILLADVGEMDQVKDAVNRVQNEQQKVDCVVCNAGVLLNEKKETSNGTEMTIASHLIGGSYLLTKLLLPQLQASKKDGGDPRVIFVTSGGMLLSKFPDWSIATHQAKDQVYDGVQAYTYAKRGQVLLAKTLAKQNNDITFVSAHPGWAATNAVEDAFGDQKSYLEPLRETWEGAEGISWLMGTKRELKNGALYLDRKEQKRHMAGPFFSEGSFTKNTDDEIESFMEHLKDTCGL